MKEQFLPVFIKELSTIYMVSDKGTVKSLPRVITKKNGMIQTVKERILKTYDVKGYKVVDMFNSNKKYRVYLHVLVAYSHMPKVAGKPEVNHRDGNKHNNVLTNLEFMSRSENVKHSYRIKGNYGERMKHSRIIQNIEPNIALTEEDLCSEVYIDKIQLYV